MTTADPLVSIGPPVRNSEQSMETRASVDIGHRIAGCDGRREWFYEIMKSIGRALG
jgi:hypothetical protein